MPTCTYNFLTMNNLPKSAEIVDIIESDYNSTVLSKHQLSRIHTILSECNGDNIVAELESWMDTVESRDSLNKTGAILNSLANKAEAKLANAVIADDLRECAPYALERADTRPTVVQDRNFLSDEKVVEYLDSLETSAQRVFCFLARYAGLTKTCMLRADFSDIASGKVTVGPQTEVNQPCERTVPFDSSYLKKKDLEEVVSYMANKVLHPGGYGLSGDEVIGQHTHGLEFTLRDLRNSHAVSLLQQGRTWNEVAEIQGVGVTSFRDRVSKFMSINGINL